MIWNAFSKLVKKKLIKKIKAATKTIENNIFNKYLTLYLLMNIKTVYIRRLNVKFIKNIMRANITGKKTRNETIKPNICNIQKIRQNPFIVLYIHYFYIINIIQIILNKQEYGFNFLLENHETSIVCPIK
ncbi:hypothetical protein F994_01974 [Acinetobacter bohemicus ANC 3994]|uniref:Uncharacterized protein n=1 Tax=Acinetobacter bohemicus ANC 3994 TaxID=1217715 RepID=N8QCW3_9GAMM|nr:hypothetical protein F994_01974 [Acinetobacter bohemicus ANC 3994]